jgi:TM2 domain-containing membrane protein YozV
MVKRQVRRDFVKLKSVSWAYALWLLMGLFGAHWFYLGRPGRGVLYALTFGLFGIGWAVDAFRLPAAVREAQMIQVRRAMLSGSRRFFVVEVL